MSQTVVAIPGLPPDVEVRRSTRRRRSVTAYRENGRTVVVVPQRMARAEILPYVEELVGRLAEREHRTRRTDAQLEARAAVLSRRFLQGRAEPSSVRWVSNQRRRWGSCTPADGSIRLSDRLTRMPEYVVDYVLLHELVHLLVPHHGPAFEAWMTGYPRLLEARAFLAGVDHATGLGLGADLDETESEAAEPVVDPADVGAAAPVASGALAPRRTRLAPGGGADPLFKVPGSGDPAQALGEGHEVGDARVLPGDLHREP